MLCAPPCPHSKMKPFPSSAAIDLPCINYRELLSIKVIAQTMVSSVMWSFRIVLRHPPPQSGRSVLHERNVWDISGMQWEKTSASASGTVSNRSAGQKMSVERAAEDATGEQQQQRQGREREWQPPCAMWEGLRERPECGIVDARFDPHESQVEGCRSRQRPRWPQQRKSSASRVGACSPQVAPTFRISANSTDIHGVGGNSAPASSTASNRPAGPTISGQKVSVQEEAEKCSPACSTDTFCVEIIGLASRFQAAPDAGA